MFSYNSLKITCGGDNLWGFKRYKNRSEYGKKFGNWFSTFNREVATQDPLKCFHSFRHTVANALKQAGEQEGFIAELLGHKNNSITTGRSGKKFLTGILFDKFKTSDIYCVSHEQSLFTSYVYYICEKKLDKPLLSVDK